MAMTLLQAPPETFVHLDMVHVQASKLLKIGKDVSIAVSKIATAGFRLLFFKLAFADTGMSSDKATRAVISFLFIAI
jgi:hypothetical protein